MNTAVKLLLLTCAAGGLYSTLRTPPPPPPDSAVSLAEARALLQGLFEDSTQACYLVPALPRARQVGSSGFAVPTSAGGRRPYLSDLVAAGVLVFDPDEQAEPVRQGDKFIERPPVETIRVAPRYSDDAKFGGHDRTALCFATLKVDSVQAVRRSAPGSDDHLLQFRWRVAAVSDWVRRLPPEAQGEAAAWLAQPLREATVMMCYSKGRAGVEFGKTCAGAYLPDAPERWLQTGPQPEDNVGGWAHWPHRAVARAAASAPN